MCLVCLERDGLGDEVEEGLGTLAAGSRQAGEDLPSVGAGGGLVAAGEFAGDDGGAQLALGQVVGGVHPVMIQKGEEVIALLVQPGADAFFVRVPTGDTQTRLLQSCG